MKKTLLILSILLLTSCGTPENQVVELTPQVEVVSENEIPTENTSCTQDDLKECEQKTEACITDIETLNAKITSLEKSLALAKNTKSNTSSVYSNILLEYLNKVEQDEFAFDYCGPISKFYTENWFNEFKTKLGEENIFFSPRKQALEASDFYGACRSSKGGIAVFLGAGYKNEDEFHLIKYDYKNSLISKSILVHEKCEDCPVEFLNRNGAYISMKGENGTLYRYFFDKNILAEENDFTSDIDE